MREGWREASLGELFAPNTERLGPHDLEPPVFSISKYDGVVPAGEFFGKRVASAKLDNYKLLRNDAWVYSTIHIDEGSIARNATGADGVVSPMYTVMRWVSEEDDPRYAELLLRSTEMLAVYSDSSQGSVNRRRSLPWRTFSSIPVALPPLKEQRRIVDLIAAVDEAVDASQREAGEYDRLWWSVADKLIETVRASRAVPLGSISDIGGGLSKSKTLSEAADAEEYPFLRAANVMRRYLALEEVHTIKAPPTKAMRAALADGDLLMTEGGDRDKLGRGTVWRDEVPGCIHQNHVFRVRLTDDEFHPEFVSAWANSYGQGWFDVEASQTTGIASISKSTLSKFPIPAISRTEQERWARALDNAWAAHRQSRKEANALRSLRTNLLTVLLTGEHEIPASYDALLEGANE